MASKIKVDQLETADGTGTIALQNQLSGMTSASMPTGSVLQVVQGTELESTITNSSTSFADMSISANITPISTSSKILVKITGLQQNARHSSSTTASVETQLLRGSTVIYRPAITTSEYQQLISIGSASSVDNWILQHYEWLDSPSSTSSLTYKLQGRMVTGSYIRCRSGHITLMEIAG
jgi:hypothetical protein